MVDFNLASQADRATDEIWNHLCERRHLNPGTMSSEAIESVKSFIRVCIYRNCKMQPRLTEETTCVASEAEGGFTLAEFLVMIMFMSLFACGISFIVQKSDKAINQAPAITQPAKDIQ